MLNQLMIGAVLSFLNFGIHALMTGLIIVATRHTAAATDELHAFVRITALLTVTMIVLMTAHVVEIGVWAAFYTFAEIPLRLVTAFEFAFENYTALGYGDAIAGEGWRLIGPITALNGLLLIGWSVAIIFEVLRMAELHIGRGERRAS